MAIQMRRGQEVNFDADKMLPGEWAVSLDTRYVRMCFAPGVCVRMATYDAFEIDMAKIEAILAECQTIEEVVTRINTEVSTNAQAVAEYTSQAKQYRDEAEEFRNQAEEIVGFGKATKDDLGIIRGGDNYIDENGTLVLTRTTAKRELIESQNGGIRIISMDGESQQATYSGKNLGNLDDRTITAGTNAYAFTSWVIANYIKTNMTYTVSFYTDFTSNMSVNVYDANISAWGAGSNEVKPSNGRASFTFKTGDNLTNFNKLLIYAGVPGITAGNTVKVWDIQIEQGSSMTKYEPYVGGIASPNPEYEQAINSVEVSEISSHGKNYLKNTAKTQTINGVTFTVNDDGSVLVNGTASAKATFIINSNVKLKKGKYIFAKNYRPYNVNNGVDRNKDGRYEVVAASHGAEFEVTEETEDRTFTFYVQVVANATVNNVTFYPLLRKSSDDDTYEPYTATKETLSAPIVLRGIGDVKDVLCKQNGVYGVLRAIRHRRVLESDISGKFYHDSSWGNANAFSISNFFSDSVRIANYTTIVDVMCTHLTVDIPNNITSISKNKIGQAYYNMFMSVDGVTTEAEAKSWVNANEVYVDYPLATPTFEPLPLADQIALHKLESFGGVTYLFTDSTIEPIIEVEYGTSKVGGYAIKGLNNGEISLLELEQLKTLTNELATQIVAGSEA